MRRNIYEYEHIALEVAKGKTSSFSYEGTMTQRGGTAPVWVWVCTSYKNATQAREGAEDASSIGDTEQRKCSILHDGTNKLCSIMISNG